MQTTLSLSSGGDLQQVLCLTPSEVGGRAGLISFTNVKRGVSVQSATYICESRHGPIFLAQVTHNRGSLMFGRELAIFIERG